MTVRRQFLDLQWSQLKHDEAYHKDVMAMALAQRIKHMALHNAKYAAYFLIAADVGDDAQMIRTLVDAFVITLASANTLNQDLGAQVSGSNSFSSIEELGAELAKSLPRHQDDPLWLVRQFVHHNGKLAKICEGWDHLESIPFSDGMKACNLALLQAVLAEASARGLNLSDAYIARIREIEARSMFDSQFREGAGGEA